MKNILLVTLAVCLIMPSLMFALDNKLAVTGTSEIVDNDKKVAEKNAIEDAKKKAVEQGLRLYLESTSETSRLDMVRSSVMDRYDDYVISADLLKKGTNDEKEFYAKMEIIVDLTKIEEIVRKSASTIKQEIGNPTISFVLTTWETKGVKSNVIIDDKKSMTGSSDYEGSASYNKKADATYDYNAKANVDINVDTTKGLRGTGKAEVSRQASGSYSSETGLKASDSMNINSDYHRDLAVTKIDEELWTKVPDMSIIDAFQQEFKDKGFDLKATDKAREIAMAVSIVSTAVNPTDRKAVRDQAEKEGVNFVARGEAMVTDIRQTGHSVGVKDSVYTNSSRPIFSRKTSDVAIENIDVSHSDEYIATVKVGVEIIDVNSGDIVGSYSNSETAINSNPALAKSQGVKKCAVLAARTLASQTLTTWQERAQTGNQFTIEIHKITSIRSQQRPIIQAIEAIGAKTQSITTPEQGKLLIQCVYKGNKTDLGYKLLDNLGSQPGFEDGKFDGPYFEGGLIIFKFLK